MKVRCFNGPYAGFELEIPEDTAEWSLTRPSDSDGRPVNAVYEFAIDAKGTPWLVTPAEGTPVVRLPLSEDKATSVSDQQLT